MTDEEWDYFNWRIDNLQRMLTDLADSFLGQFQQAQSFTRFHNDEVIKEAKKVRIGVPE